MPRREQAMAWDPALAVTSARFPYMANDLWMAALEAAAER